MYTHKLLQVFKLDWRALKESYSVSVTVYEVGPDELLIRNSRYHGRMMLKSICLDIKIQYHLHYIVMYVLVTP